MSNNGIEWHVFKTTEAAWGLVAQLTGALFFPRPNASELGEFMGEVMFALGDALNVRRRSPDILDWFAWNCSPKARLFKRKHEELKKRLRLEIIRFVHDSQQNKRNPDQDD